MTIAFNDIQLEILHLFSEDQSEEELREIKSLLTTYLSDREKRLGDKSFNEMGYTSALFTKWKNEHFRKSSL